MVLVNTWVFPTVTSQKCFLWKKGIKQKGPLLSYSMHHQLLLANAHCTSFGDLLYVFVLDNYAKT